MKTAFITGGSSDIGRAIAGTLSGEGWSVIAPSRKELDLSKLDSIGAKTEKIIEDVTALDAVIHVAGVWHDDESVYRKDLEDYSAGQIADIMNVSLTGFMVLLSNLLPKMPKNGAVIGVSGTFADGASGWLPYYVSKRGLEDMLVGLSQDYPSGPRVYGVSPADTATQAYARFFPENISDAQPVEIVARTVHRLLGDTAVTSGTVVAVRQSKVRPGFHK